MNKSLTCLIGIYNILNQMNSWAKFKLDLQACSSDEILTPVAGSSLNHK